MLKCNSEKKRYDDTAISPLDQPRIVTRFPNKWAARQKALTISLRDLADEIQHVHVKDKLDLPSFHLATFGRDKTENECLRTNANLTAITGIEIDYDSGQIQVRDAVRRFRRAGIAALVHSSANSTAENPRWHAYIPTSEAMPPEARTALVEQANAIFDGEIDQHASFTPSQAIFSGNVDGREPVEVRLVDGDYIDRLADLPRLPKGERPSGDGTRTERDRTGSGQLFDLASRIKSEAGSRDDFEAAISDHPDAHAHVERNGERALDRAWERAPEHPGLTLEDVRALLDDLPPDDNVDPRAKLNRHHAVVTLGGKTAIMTEGVHGISFGTEGDLRLRYKNRPFRATKATLADAWLSWEGRREFPNGVVFRPDGATPDGTFNLWRGWAVVPDPSASCDLFLDHLHDVICNGDEEQYLWLLGWLAHMVQRPGEKPRSAIVLRGEKGAGKDIVGVYLSRLMDKSAYLNTADSDAIIGQFNSAIANALFVHLEEAFFHGDHKADSRIKNLVTAETMSINEKFAPRYTVESFHRLFITSNECRVVNATSGERRYFISEVSSDRCGDQAYFDALFQEMKGDGPAALMATLMAYDLSKWSPRPPATEALLEHIAENLRGVEAWLSDCIEAGGILSGERMLEWPDEPMPTRALRNAYDGWGERPMNRYRAVSLSETAFGKQIKPFARRRKIGPRKAREWGYDLLPLDATEDILMGIIGRGNS